MQNHWFVPLTSTNSNHNNVTSIQYYCKCKNVIKSRFPLWSYKCTCTTFLTTWLNFLWQNILCCLETQLLFTLEMESSFSLPSLSKCSLWLLSAIRYWVDLWWSCPWLRHDLGIMNVWQIKVFLYPSFDAFFVYTEYRMQLETQKIFLQIIFSSLIKTALSITCRLWCAELQQSTKNSSDSNNLSESFSSFCPGLFSVPCTIDLFVANTLACTTMTLEYSAVIWHWLGQMAACMYLYHIYVISGRIVVESGGKELRHEFGVCQRAYY